MKLLEITRFNIWLSQHIRVLKNSVGVDLLNNLESVICGLVTLSKRYLPQSCRIAITFDEVFSDMLMQVCPRNDAVVTVGGKMIGLAIEDRVTAQ